MPGRIYPWRTDNGFELLVDGPQFFPRMFEHINRAQRQVELELYLVESGACVDLMVQVLCAAAERGVQVRCLFDAFGSSAFSAVDRERLVQAGIELRFYNPIKIWRWQRNLYRDHRKLLLVDGEVAFVGGTGVTDAFWTPGEASSAWHEVMVQIRGPLVQDWQDLFEQQWLANPQNRAWLPFKPGPRQRIPQRPMGGAGLGRVAYANAMQHRDIVQSLVRALNSAQRRIWLATPYFLPSWKVRRALRKAAQRGVDVQLLLTGRQTDNPPVRFAGQRYYPRLLRAGVKIFEYQPCFLHLKMVLVDDWTSIGSCNFDHWNLRFNLEANLEAVEPPLTAAVVQSFTNDFAQSKQITLELWKTRPLWKRAQQRLWGWMDRLVVNLLDRRK
ncbi:MAG: phosphatidylserine/phosphatidylglycerophosphate/cardiolipin synthase family protein [Pseudomonas sp.]